MEDRWLEDWLLEIMPPPDPAITRGEYLLGHPPPWSDDELEAFLAGEERAYRRSLVPA